MTDLGQLQRFLDKDKITYEMDGKEESFLFPAEAVLRFHTQLEGLKDDGVQRFGRLNIYELTAPVLGSKWNKTKATFDGGLLNKLLKAGQPFTVIDRTVSAVFVLLQYGDEDLAELMFQHGDLPKALREQAERRKAEEEAKLAEMKEEESEEQTD